MKPVRVNVFYLFIVLFPPILSYGQYSEDFSESEDRNWYANNNCLGTFSGSVVNSNQVRFSSNADNRTVATPALTFAGVTTISFDFRAQSATAGLAASSLSFSVEVRDATNPTVIVESYPSGGLTTTFQTFTTNTTALTGTYFVVFRINMAGYAAFTYLDNISISASTIDWSTLADGGPCPAHPLPGAEGGPSGSFYPTTMKYTALPYPFLCFPLAPHPANGHFTLTWTSALEPNNQHYTLERSLNGGLFEPVHQQPSLGTALQGHTYSWADAQPWSGPSRYYRLSQTDFDGQSQVLGMIRVEHPQTPTKPMLIKTAEGFALQASEGLSALRLMDGLGRTLVEFNHTQAMPELLLPPGVSGFLLYQAVLVSGHVVSGRLVLP